MAKPKIVDVRAAKSSLSGLIKRANSGQEVIIARDGVPAAKLVPITGRAPKRRFGALAGPSK